MEPIHKDLHDNHQFKIYGYKTYRNDTALFKSLKLSFEKYMKIKLEEFSGSTIKEFCLENYHNHLQEVNCDHHQFISSIGRRVDIKHLDMKYIRELIKIANKDFNKEFHIYDSKVEFRVVRPNNEDNNDLHRDHWFPYFTPLVNVYLPLASSYHDSALGIVPFSHEWSEEDVIPTFTYEESVAGKKYIKNGIEYSVPAVEKCSHDINLHRADLTEGDFMLFSPKMVHGGGTNGSHETRFSFEIRLEKT
tara:strand:+ start:706 stop:1449 length:744 start_codon:yes stop_codon:yes gene_type:complete